MKKFKKVFAIICCLVLLSSIMFFGSTVQAASAAGDVVGKVIVGYQGWFDAPGDGAPANSWVHWANGSMPSPGNQNFEIYPDFREFTTLFGTGYANLGNGTAAKLFSSYTTQTVNKHFEWMQTYGIDGAAVQRFGGELSDPNRKAQRDSVLTKVRTASETYGRKFYVMYDISGMGTGFDSQIESDWTNTIKNTMNLTSSSAYAMQNGKPVVCIWGMGFNDGSHPGDATTCINCINWFKNQGLYVIGGVPTYWRDCDNANPLASDPAVTNDSKTGFQTVYKTFNMIEPWLVGRIKSTTGNDSVDNFNTYIVGPDYSYCQSNGMDYAPVMFPGFAWSNMHNGSTPKNEIPRMHGDFMWNQAYDTATSGITSGYIAMFDEFDEGTAISKAAEDSSMIPTNQYFLTLDADGVHCSSDYYLRLTGDITKMLKGQIQKTSTHPTPFVVGTKYEAETGTLANGATVAADSAASGGECIQNMHLANASCQINNIDGGSGGSQTLNLIYAANGTGTISIYVNGTLVASPSFPTTGGWSTYTGNLQQAITLNSGTGNNIKFVGGNGGINLDYINITGTQPLTKIEAETGTLANGATVGSDSAASGGASVQNMHLANASCQLNSINGGTGGSKTLNIIYAANGTGTLSIYVNGTLVASPSFPTTGGWSTYTGNLKQTITLNSGTGNNIKFVGGNGGINLDYITIQ